VAEGDPTHADLLAIHSRLGVIEGKVNLVARAERDALRKLLEAEIRKHPESGQIYLLLDGERTRQDIHKLMNEYGIAISDITVWRRIKDMETEHGIVRLVGGAGNSLVYNRDPETEKLLNLAAKIREWLKDEGQVIPEKAKRPRKKKS
jgi:hypothetical protein